MAEEETGKDDKPKKVVAKKAPGPKIGAEKKPEKEVKKVVTGEVVKHKRPILERVKSSFISGEVSGVARYLGGEVLLPALRNLIVDAATQGIERIIYGDTARRPGPRRQQGNMGRFQYNTSSSRGYSPHPQQSSQPSRGRSHKAEQINLGRKEDAVMVLETLIEMIDQYEMASVADLYQLIGWEFAYTDNKYGWTNLSDADIRQSREGFLLILPDVERLD